MPTPTPAEWARVWTWVLPWEASACVLINAGLSPTQLTALAVGDCAVTDSGIAVSAHDLSITGSPAQLLAAQLHFRNAQGAASQDPLFAGADGPRNIRQIADAPGDAAIELGVRLGPPRAVRRHSPKSALARRIGLSVTELHRSAA